MIEWMTMHWCFSDPIPSYHDDYFLFSQNGRLEPEANTLTASVSDTALSSGVGQVDQSGESADSATDIRLSSSADSGRVMRSVSDSDYRVS